MWRAHKYRGIGRDGLAVLKHLCLAPPSQPANVLENDTCSCIIMDLCFGGFNARVALCCGNSTNAPHAQEYWRRDICFNSLAVLKHLRLVMLWAIRWYVNVDTNNYVMNLIKISGDVVIDKKVAPTRYQLWMIRLAHKFIPSQSYNHLDLILIPGKGLISNTSLGSIANSINRVPHRMMRESFDWS